MRHGAHRRWSGIGRALRRARDRSSPAGFERVIVEAGSGMSSRGQSLSMFVIQRTFTRVRRGYDPDEVDRHLELVSRWFTSTDAGRAIAEERARLRERESEAQHLLEGARLEADATLEGARRRADADARAAEQTLAEARRTLDAARIEAAAAEAIRTAEAEAAAIRDQARAGAAAAARPLGAKTGGGFGAFVGRRRRGAARIVRAARRERDM